MKRAKKAGVLPQRAVQASNWPAVMCVTVPMVVKSQSTRWRAEAVAVEVEVITVVEAQTKEAVLGMARTIVVGAWERVEPLALAAGLVVGLEGWRMPSI